MVSEARKEADDGPEGLDHREEARTTLNCDCTDAISPVRLLARVIAATAKLLIGWSRWRRKLFETGK